MLWLSGFGASARRPRVPRLRLWLLSLFSVLPAPLPSSSPLGVAGHCPELVSPILSGVTSQSAPLRDCARRDPAYGREAGLTPIRGVVFPDAAFAAAFPPRSPLAPRPVSEVSWDIAGILRALVLCCSGERAPSRGRWWRANPLKGSNFSIPRDGRAKGRFPRVFNRGARCSMCRDLPSPLTPSRGGAASLEITARTWRMPAAQPSRPSVPAALRHTGRSADRVGQSGLHFDR